MFWFNSSKLGCIVLDIFVECSSLKSFSHGIEVDKVKYFFGNFTPQ